MFVSKLRFYIQHSKLGANDKLGFGVCKSKIENQFVSTMEVLLLQINYKIALLENWQDYKQFKFREKEILNIKNAY